MTTKPKLDAELSGTPIDQTRYHSMIKSLMYLSSSRPDIAEPSTWDSGIRRIMVLNLPYFQMLIMPDALILAKALMEEYNS
ncbi:hypothetical protein Tco_0867431 [Tanacetum coccineum]